MTTPGGVAGGAELTTACPTAGGTTAACPTGGGAGEALTGAGGTSVDAAGRGGVGGDTVAGDARVAAGGPAGETWSAGGSGTRPAGEETGTGSETGGEPTGAPTASVICQSLGEKSWFADVDVASCRRVRARSHRTSLSAATPATALLTRRMPAAIHHTASTPMWTILRDRQRINCHLRTT